MLRLPEYYVASCNEQIAGSQQTRMLLEQILGQSCSRAICGVLCRTFKDELIHFRLDFFMKQQKKNVSCDCQNTTWHVVRSKLQGASESNSC